MKQKSLMARTAKRCGAVCGARRVARVHGFVLLAVIILLALVAVLMLGLSRRSVARASEALSAEAALQRKWGAATARATVLPRATKILAVENKKRREERDPATASIRADVELGDQLFTFVVSDEQAKANVNTLWRELEGDRLNRAVRELLPSKMSGAAVSLAADPRAVRPEPKEKRHGPKEGDFQIPYNGKPVPGYEGEPGVAEEAAVPVTPEAPMQPLAFAAWGQVFSPATPGRLFGERWDDEDEIPDAATSRMTCWGDGRLRLSYASPEAIEAVLTPVLTEGQIRRILSNRTDKPEGPVDAWLQGLELSDEQRQGVMALTAPRSRCHALLIVGDDGWRTWHEFAVREVWSEETPQEQQQPAQGPEGGPPQKIEGLQTGVEADERPEPPKDRVFRFSW